MVDRGPRWLRAHAWSRRTVAAVVVALGLCGTGALTTDAILSDSATSNNVQIGSGKVTLGLTPASQTYTFALAPGDTYTTPVTVANSGTMSMRYAITGTSDATDANFIAARLKFTAKTGVTTCTNSGFGTDGTVVAGPVQAGSTTGVNVLGNPAQGAQAGDRTLASGNSETLCLQVSLPANQLGDIGGRSTTITYAFAAEQTANNP